MLTRLFFKIYNSPTIMNWLNQFTVFFHGIFVTSLILVKFPNLEYSFWMLLKTLSAFGLLAEAGLGFTIERAVSTFFAGAKRLPKNYFEYKESAAATGSPDIENLRELLYTTKYIYVIISMATILILSTVGIALLWNLFDQSGQSAELWVAYGLMIIQSFLALQTIKWRSFMTGTRHLAQLYRFNTLMGVIRIFGFLALLLNNLGVAYLMLYTLAEQIVTYIYVRNFIGNWFIKQNHRLQNLFRLNKDIFRSLWSVSWKSGLNTWGYFFTNKGIELITSQLKDTTIMASYLFTNSILGFIRNIAQTPVTVQYPYYYGLLAVKDYPAVKKEASPRIFLSNFLMIAGIVCFGLLGNWFLDFIHAEDKSLVPSVVYIIISGYLVLEQNALFHGTFYLTTNDVPFLVPGLITGILTVTLGILLMPVYGLPGLVSVQLLLNLACNFWYSTYLSLKLMNWSLKSYLHDVLLDGPNYWISRLMTLKNKF